MRCLEGPQESKKPVRKIALKIMPPGKVIANVEILFKVDMSMMLCCITLKGLLIRNDLTKYLICGCS